MNLGNDHACHDCQTILARSVDGPLPVRERARRDDHLERCAACRAFAETLGVVDAALRHVAAEERSVDAAGEDAFLTAVLGRIERAPQRTRSLTSAFALAAAVLLAAGWVALIVRALDEQDAPRRAPAIAVQVPTTPPAEGPARPEPVERETGPEGLLANAGSEDLERMDPLRLYGARYVVEKALLNSHGLDGEALLSAVREKTSPLRRERWPIEHLVLKLVDRNADEPSHLETDERAMLVALRWIGAVRPSGALPVLKRVLDPEPRTAAIRGEALATLARLGHERALDHLVDLARRPSTYPEAASSLALAGDVGLEKLLALYEGQQTHPSVRDVLENHRPALDRVLAQRIGSSNPDAHRAELYRLFGGERCRSVLLAEAERKRRLGRGLVTVAVAIGGVEAFDLLLETVEKSSPRDRERLTASLTQLLELEGEKAPTLVRRSAHLVRDEPLERINALDALTAAASRIESGHASACLFAILELADLAPLQKANVLLHLLNRPATEAPELGAGLAQRLADPALAPLEFAGIATVLAGRSSPEDLLAKPVWKPLDDSRRRKLIRGLEEAVAAQPGVAGLTALDRLLPITEASRRRSP